tara:strand:+ start:384 stop:977 length:594 start_codon:yes stop_codon:yes gene_type:complete
MEYGQQMQQAQENAKLAFYQNPSYQFERREKKILILDVHFAADTPMATEFSVNLLEPLRIDRLSDIYLDSFVTENQISGGLENGNSDVKNSGMVLKINEFNINSNVATNLHSGTSGEIDSGKFNSIYIPNITKGVGAFAHKAKKFNYVASINPTTLTTISGSLTDAGTNNNPPVYISPFTAAADGRMTAEFMIVARD